MNIFPDFAPGISPGDAPFIAHNQRVLSAAPPFMTVTRDALFGLAVAIPGGLSSGENFCRYWRITTPDGSQRTRAASGGLYRLDGPRAAYWAEHCGWVPGTEFCPGIPASTCREECFFRAWRDRGSKVIRLARQRRQRSQIPNR